MKDRRNTFADGVPTGRPVSRTDLWLAIEGRRIGKWLVLALALAIWGYAIYRLG